MERKTTRKEGTIFSNCRERTTHSEIYLDVLAEVLALGAIQGGGGEGEVGMGRKVTGRKKGLALGMGEGRGGCFRGEICAKNRNWDAGEEEGRKGKGRGRFIGVKWNLVGLPSD